MDWFLSPLERAEALEDSVDVADVGLEREDLLEVDPAREIGVRAHEVAQVEVALPRLQCVRLHAPVGIVAAEPRIDQCKQQPLAREQPVARIEIATHPLLVDDEAL